VNSTRLLLRRLKNRDRDLTRKPLTPIGQWPHLKERLIMRKIYAMRQA
jgi:hypothetical protein